MKIKLFARLMPGYSSLSVSKDALRINGEKFDFAKLKEGQRLPSTAISSDHFIFGSYVERKQGEINLEIAFPVTEETPYELRNPVEPIVLSVSSGPVTLPWVEGSKDD